MNNLFTLVLEFLNGDIEENQKLTESLMSSWRGCRKNLTTCWFFVLQVKSQKSWQLRRQSYCQAQGKWYNCGRRGGAQDSSQGCKAQNRLYFRNNFLENFLQIEFENLEKLYIYECKKKWPGRIWSFSQKTSPSSCRAVWSKAWPSSRQHRTPEKLLPSPPLGNTLKWKHLLDL